MLKTGNRLSTSTRLSAEMLIKRRHFQHTQQKLVGLDGKKHERSRRCIYQAGRNSPETGRHVRQDEHSAVTGALADHSIAKTGICSGTSPEP